MDLVGPSELLKPSLIESVLPLNKPPTTDTQWRTSSLAVEPVDTDVEEDTPSKPGDIGSTLESLLETETETTNGANHTSSHLADLTAHLLRLPPQPVLSNASPNTLEFLTANPCSREKALTPLLLTSLPSKLRS